MPQARETAPLIEAIAEEFRAEMPATRRLLERVPSDKLGWRPHPKSRSLGELATHVANIPGMAEWIVKHDEFRPSGPPATAPGSAAEIRAIFEKNALDAEEIINQVTEQQAAETWRLVFRGKEVVRRSRASALRTNLLNHLYHHRGQLGVYLRLLDVPVPVVYGPTADENPFL